jgi:hypothetical protein
MKKDSFELLFEESNFAVVKLPKRAFPGVVIQGDSLIIIQNLINELINLVDEGEAKEIAEELYEHVDWRIRKYEDVPRNNQLLLPCVRDSL